MHLKKVVLLGLCITWVSGYLAAQTPIEEYGKTHYPPNWNQPTAMPDRIMLNCTDDLSGSASITWRTRADITDSYLELAPAAASPDFWKGGQRFAAHNTLMDAAHIPAAAVKACYHHVLLKGLLPGTMYAYRVGNGEYWSEWFQFRTAADKPEPFSFIYLGDAQSSIFDRWSRTLRSAIQQAPRARFIIHAGDLVGSAHDDKHWQEWFLAGGWIHATIPGVPVAGNHEYQVLDKSDKSDSTLYLSRQWEQQFKLPQNGPAPVKGTCYYFHYQNEALIVVLNSSEALQTQAEWLEEVLAKDTSTWTILAFHHPVFSGARERDNAYLRSLWKPIIDRYHVDLVLTGHDHIYTRGLAFEDQKDGRRTLKETVYVTSVAGGKMYPASENLWGNYEAALKCKAEQKQLFQVIHIDGPSLRYEAFTADGQLYDAFQLHKDKNKDKDQNTD